MLQNHVQIFSVPGTFHCLEKKPEFGNIHKKARQIFHFCTNGLVCLEAGGKFLSTGFPSIFCSNNMLCLCFATINS